MEYPPGRQGLYDPRHEHDACGMGFVVNLKGEKSHEIIRKGIEILINLTHRGACGCDPETGDGAGILIQIPHEFFARECADLGFSLPEPGTYGIGMMFLPVEKQQRLICEGVVEKIASGSTILFVACLDGGKSRLGRSRAGVTAQSFALVWPWRR